MGCFFSVFKQEQQYSISNQKKKKQKKSDSLAKKNVYQRADTAYTHYKIIDNDHIRWRQPNQDQRRGIFDEKRVAQRTVESIPKKSIYENISSKQSLKREAQRNVQSIPKKSIQENISSKQSLKREAQRNVQSIPKKSIYENISSKQSLKREAQRNVQSIPKKSIQENISSKQSDISSIVKQRSSSNSSQFLPIIRSVNKQQSKQSSLSISNPLNQKRIQKINYIKTKYSLTNQNAKELSKTGYKIGQRMLSINQCKNEMKKQLQNLQEEYLYNFEFYEAKSAVRGKRMTRTIYLKFKCSSCKNEWTTIAGTFEITFKLQKRLSQFYLEYFIKIYGTDCKNCEQLMIPSVYETQMEAMKIFFSVIITNIMDDVPPPQKPGKYYIKENHWHKSQWCQACKQGKCTTQNRNKQ